MGNSDEAFRESLCKAYETRAKLFVKELEKRSVDPLIEFLNQQNHEKLDWKSNNLGISRAAIEKVKAAGVQPHFVFCHPQILLLNKKLIDYYRNLASISKKGLSQMLGGLPTDRRLGERCALINKIISAIVEEMPAFDLALARAVIPAEIGAEIQGTWVNIIGRGAANRVRSLIEQCAQDEGWIKQIDEKKFSVKIAGKTKTRKHVCIRLINGWTITFADEPDIAIRDSKEILRSAIEIKGSLDKAGAQSRYGEAKKSFGKALKEHGQCETIYLASCFTDAVQEQIRSDAYVRRIFNLVDVFADAPAREKFLEELFFHIIRIKPVNR